MASRRRQIYRGRRPAVAFIAGSLASNYVYIKTLVEIGNLPFPESQLKSRASCNTKLNNALVFMHL
jgi:hypothetical protein